MRKHTINFQTNVSKILITLLFVVSGSKAFAQGAPVTNDVDAVEAPAGSTLWINKQAPIRDCEDADSNLADIDAGRTELEAASIRVLGSERNLHPSAKAPGRKCGDTGGYVACFMIFGSDQKKAMSMGYKVGGLCGQPSKKRVH